MSGLWAVPGPTAVVVAVVVFALVAVADYVILDGASRREARTRDILRRSVAVEQAFTAMTWELQGYALSGDAGFLDAYEAARAARDREYRALETAVGDEPALVGPLAAFRQALDAWEHEVAVPVLAAPPVARAGGYAPARSRALSDDARARRLAFAEAELTLQRQVSGRALLQFAGLGLAALAVVGLVLLSAGGRRIHRLAVDLAVHQAVERELQRRLEQQAAVAALGQQALAGGDLPALFQRATELVARGLDVEYAKVLELEPDGRQLLLRAGVGWRLGAVGAARVSTGKESQAGYTLAVGGPVIVLDARTERRFKLPPLLLEHGVLSGLSVVIGDPARPYGVLGAHSTVSRQFSDDDVHFLTAVANILAAAVDRDRTLAALAASERDYRLLLEQASDAIFVADADGNYRVVNSRACALLGYSREELLRLNVRDVLPSQDLAAQPLRFEELREGVTLLTERRLRRKDGALVPVEISATRLPNGLLQATVRDITERQRAERERQMLAALAENSQDFIGVGTLDDRVLYLNAAGRRLVGLPPDFDVTTLSAADFASPEELARWRDVIAPQVRAKGKWVGEGRLQHFVTGEAIDVETTVFTIPDPETGEPVYRATVMRDIRERKRAERERQMLAALVENNQDFIAVTTLDTQVLYLNDAGRRLVGLPSDFDVTGTRAADYVPADTVRLQQETILPAVQATGRWTGEARLRHFITGEVIDTEATVFVIPDPTTGAPLYLATVSRDIRAQKRAAAAAQREAERFRQLTENIREVFWLTNVEKTEMVYVSPAYEEIWGRSRASLYASPRDWLDTIHPEDRPRVLAALERQAEGTYDEVYRIVRPDGTVRWVHDRAFPIRDEQGHVYRIGGVAEDITARKQAEDALAEREAQLRQMQKLEAIGQLAGGVAHDFNNLLMVINGFSELLLMRLAEDDPRRPMVEQIAKAGEQAAGVTRQLLAFSRRQVLQPEVLDLNDVVREMQHLLRRLIEERIEIVTALPPDLPSVKADRVQLQQVLLNLAVNARDAMPGSGRLTLETGLVQLAEPLPHAHGTVPPGTYVTLAVRDTGVGMPPEVLERVFEPFFTTKERGRGTGLGLATVYGIVAQSGGYLAVASAPGHGTTFTVYLPTALAEAGEALRATAAAPGPAPARPSGTVLVVEDDPQVRAFVRQVLGAEGYTVLEAPNGHEALRLAATHRGPIDLLLTDVVMPGLDGRELAARLAAQRPGLKTLYMSGYTDDIIAPHGLLEPGVTLLSKPLTPQALVAAVRQALAAADPPA